MVLGPGGEAGIPRANEGLPPDYHVHTWRCGHGEGSPAEYVEAARALAIPAIGISDHVPRLQGYDPELAMHLSEVEEYVREVQVLKRRYPGYVLLGVEADYTPGRMDEMRAFLDEFPFDYVIGSVHELDGWGFEDPRSVHGFAERNVDDVYRQYFEAMGDAAETGAFTILGHLDVVKKYGHRPGQSLRKEQERLADRIASAGVLVEINTAGLAKPVGEIYPSVELLRLLHVRGVGITFGSDAHSPSEVGRHFAEGVEAARAAGYEEYAVLAARDEASRTAVRSVRLD